MMMHVLKDGRELLTEVRERSRVDRPSLYFGPLKDASRFEPIISYGL